MREIGLGQFLKNIFDYSTGKQPSQQAGKITNENFQKTQNETMQQLNKTVQNIAQNFVSRQDILNTKMQLKELNNLERYSLLKNLFQFPDNIKDIVTFLQGNKNIINTKELQLLMTRPLDISKLVILLQTNGKEASEKIAKMIATMNQSGIYNTQQLKDIATLVNACIPASDAPASQVVKNFMLMYLPWLPIGSNIEFNIADGGGEEETKSDEDNNISIIITSKNYGIIKILLFKDNEQFNINMNCSETFPKEKFNSAINIKSENAYLNIKPDILYTTRKESNDEKNTELKVSFSKTSQITPQLLIIVHTLIKIIAEIDEQGCLEEKRKLN
jgi:hypothetical protein